MIDVSSQRGARCGPLHASPQVAASPRQLRRALGPAAAALPLTHALRRQCWHNQAKPAVSNAASTSGRLLQTARTSVAGCRPCSCCSSHQEEASTAEPGGSESRRGDASSSGRDSSSGSFGHLSKETLAAMALSPLAALSLPLVNDPAWRESAAAFGERLRQHTYNKLYSDDVQNMLAKVDEGMTYMDWTWGVTGIDFSYVWDPELWIKFKEAVFWNKPTHFWNKLWDRIEYRNKIPTTGLVGDMRISYAKFRHLLDSSRIKRIIVYGDMKTAVVEVPHPWSACLSGAPGAYPFFEEGPDGRPFGTLVKNPDAPNDPSKWFSPEMPEWNMEKYRFYVDLPGDFWEDSGLLAHLRQKAVQVTWDAGTGLYVLPYRHFTKLGEVRTELQIMDASESWDFLSWLMHENRLEFYEKAAAVCLFIRGLAIATNLASASRLVRFVRKKTKKKDRKESMWERLTKAPAREFMTRDKSGKLKDTGVRFTDIAGMDDIVFEMREIVKMLKDDPAYVRVGAKAPRGIVFQGPPGTGKTYLARAIAGEAGVTFLSAVGSEFVEMFQGVAAARVNSLYHAARQKSPCIIFIDEIDAIGRSRTTLGNDPGSQERESALLSMLVQMDGIHGNLEKVLTIGATNLAQELDPALLRPGRLEEVYEIPSPNPIARLEILRYHSKNKALESEDILVKVAEVTQGWSAAALANLMNESAILTVRRSTEKISLPMMLDIIENQEWGPSAARIPPSEAKNRLALVTAAKAVAFALTPGVDPIKHVTMWSRRKGQGPSVEFIDSKENLDPNWHPEEIEIMDFKTNFKVNAAAVGDTPLGEWFHVAGLILPLYAPRAAELAFFGPEGASLATAMPIADCFEIAYYCVRNSMLHPRFRRMPPLHTYIMLGNDKRWQNQKDPLTLGLDEQLGYHKLTLTLLKASWKRSQQLVQQRRSAITKVAEEMLAAPDEKLTGQRLVEIIESTPLDESDIDLENDFMPVLREVLGRVPSIVLEGSQAAEAEEAVTTAAAEPSSSSSSDDVASTAGPSSGPGQASFRGAEGGAGAVGLVSFTAPAASRSAAATAAAGATTGGEAAGPSKQIKVDDKTLEAVSRAIMGRLDIVDLIGRKTAEEVAERVRDSLLHPETTERLKAIRAYVEDPTAPFPPRPLAETVPKPLYGQVQMSLDWWKQRKMKVVTWNALEMLYTEGQRKYYQSDMPEYEGPLKRAAEAEKAAAAAGDEGAAKASA